MRNPAAIMALAMMAFSKDAYAIGNKHWHSQGDFSGAIALHDKNKRKKNKMQRGTAYNKRKGKSR